MSTRLRRGRSSGEAAFDAYYQELYGERWPALRTALAGNAASIGFRADLDAAGAPYYLDAASLVAASSLPLDGARRLLDLCAAPGGKTLVWASRMDKAARLTANERSAERRERLRRVLSDQLTEPLRSRLNVTAYDGARWSRFERACYDRILLDAPCSSERHVLASPKHVEAWSPARIKNVTHGEWALLSGAFLLLSDGGELLYVTCALSDAENDGMVDRLVKKYGSGLSVLPPLLAEDAAVLTRTGKSGEAPSEARVEKAAAGQRGAEAVIAAVIRAAEPTKWGLRILPDRSEGAGPLYFSRIKRIG